MGLRFRKSIKICKGLSVNLGTKGASISLGTRGLRHTIHTSGKKTTSVGLPGTGLSYVKVKGAGRNYNSKAYAKKEELKKQREEEQLTQMQENELQVKEYENRIELIKSIHQECEEVVDWNMLYEKQPPFQVGEIGPRETLAKTELESYKPSLIESAFEKMVNKKQQALEEAVQTAKEEDAKEYQEWEETHALASRVLAGDLDSYLEVISEINPLEDLVEFGSDFEFGGEDAMVLEVEFCIKANETVPDFTMSLTQAGKLSKKEMGKTAYYSLIQDYACSCMIRIAREMCALLPIKTVMVHAVETILNTETGHTEEATLISVEFKKDILNSLNFDGIDPSDALNNFNYNMKFLKTSGFKPVKRINED